MVPVPSPNETPIGVRIQPATTLEARVALPTGVMVAKVVSVDVFDAGTGNLVHHHDRPLSLALQLTPEEMAVCRSDPAKIALLHIEGLGQLTRVARGGGGLDLSIAARGVGPTGTVRVDMAESMVDRARRTLAALGLTTAEARRATADATGLPEASADCVLVNGLLNLSPSKADVLREVVRLLRPSGRLVLRRNDTARGSRPERSALWMTGSGESVGLCRRQSCRASSAPPGWMRSSWSEGATPARARRSPRSAPSAASVANPGGPTFRPPR